MTTAEDILNEHLKTESPPGTGQPQPTMRDQLLTRSQLADLPEPDPLIADTFECRSVVLLAGDRGSMKTFTSIDWAMSIAAGRSYWQRREVMVTGRVLYIAAEGAYGFDRRIDAWEHAWNKGVRVPDDRFVVYPAPVNLRDPRQMAELCGLADGCVLTVVDTFARCMVGADENSSRDVGEAVDALYQLRDAMSGTGGSVLVDHHTGKDGITTRGSSALEDGVDVVYLATANGRKVNLKRTKHKEGPESDRVSLWLNRTLDSCTLGIPSHHPISPRSEALLPIVVPTLGSGPQLRSVLKKKAKDEAGIAGSTFDRGLEDLAEAGVVRIEGMGRTAAVHLNEEAFDDDSK